MAQIDLARVITVSLQAALRGLANANTSALALITNDVPIAGAAFGDFGIYYGPASVAADWGSNSDAYKQAVSVFSQSPNPLSAGGFLVIIPRKADAAASAATLLGTGPVDLTALTATTYEISLTVDGGSDTDCTIGAVDSTSLVTAAASLNSTEVVAAGAVFSLSGSVNAAFITLKSGTAGASSLLTIGATSTGVNIAPLLGLSGTAHGVATGAEAIKDTILRTFQEVFYFGIILDVIPTDAELPELAALIQSIDKILFYAETDSAKVAGIMTTLKTSGFTQTRGLLRTESSASALIYASAYAARALSTDFTGDGTVSTMHLKDLVGFVADAGLTEAIVTGCQSAGVDVYADFGVPKVFTSGANRYFDEVYIGLALKLSIRVAGFNYLAKTSTKIPQTEKGMNGLKGAYRQVVKQFVANGAFAPGSWNETTFGNPEDFMRNIEENGFYLFSSPIAAQTQTVRESRAAPLVQIACKSAGAIHSSSVVLNIEA